MLDGGVNPAANNNMGFQMAALNGSLEMVHLRLNDQRVLAGDLTMALFYASQANCNAIVRFLCMLAGLIRLPTISAPS